ncbi:hypothetical protein FBU30_004409 [Linnemannia zychae]|nr:hypothetical protein FBU30_004409 [Linnemannia zychae]
MNFDNVSDVNVEDMSNSELFQYLFKAELDTDISDPFTQSLLPTVTVASPSSSSSSLSSPPSSTLATPSSSSASDFSSPETTSHSYNSPPPPPYHQLQQHSEQQPEQLTQIPLFQQQPMLLPSTSFSYRQLTPNMPPSKPSQPTVNTINNDNSLNRSSALDAVAASSTSTDQMNYWMQRFQQLQQLQQLHHQQQQQLLSSTLFPGQLTTISNSNNTSVASALNSQESNDGSSASPSSPASSSSSRSPSIKAEHDIVYPSPPMKDDAAMDSDSDNEGGSNQIAKASDSMKPSPSELKKMTSKERRQLRNKLSARNFRVRRKEYIGTLETQVKEARREAAELQKKLAQSELNCQFLRQELETVRLSQTLFNDGRMSREHANLLASLLNPNTESFPTTSPVNTLSSSSITMTSLPTAQELQQQELMNSINSNNMTILNNALTANQQQQIQEPFMSLPQGSIQPFVPFDSNWDLSVNRAELIVNPDLDPKETEAKSSIHNLLARYEAIKHEAEVDEQMRTELKAYHEQKLAQTYIVMPKEDTLATTWKAGQDTMFLQTMIYMMMLHLTRSLFEAATLSKTQLVNVYQTMDGNLRSQMGQVQEEKEKRASPCKFAEWREAWIRKCWPSFYNNRRRVCELLRNNICPLQAYANSIDVDETIKKMEEGVKGKTVETRTPLCVWICSRIPNWMRCPDSVAQEKRKQQEEEERKALLREAKQPTEVLA